MTAQRQNWLSIAILMGALVATGCGGSGVHPVKGQLVWKDTGQPATELVGSIVTFDQAASESSALGQVAADGSFQLTTNQQNDGARIGEHVVLLMEIGRLPTGDGTQLAPGKIPTKYASPSTSDLRAQVKRGLNQPKIEVERLMP